MKSRLYPCIHEKPSPSIFSEAKTVFNAFHQIICDHDYEMDPIKRSFPTVHVRADDLFVQHDGDVFVFSFLRTGALSSST